MRTSSSRSCEPGTNDVEPAAIPGELWAAIGAAIVGLAWIAKRAVQAIIDRRTPDASPLPVLPPLPAPGDTCAAAGEPCREGIERLCRDVRRLRELHAVTDEDGVLRWYVPQRLRRQSEQQVELLQEISRGVRELLEAYRREAERRAER